MTHLAVVVRWHGSPVVDRVVRLEDGLVLGDHDAATVVFPGARVVVRRGADGWWVGCRRLRPGGSARLVAGGVEVSFEAVEERPMLARVEGLPDPVPFVLTAAVLLVAAGLEAVASVANDHPELAETLRALLLATR